MAPISDPSPLKKRNGLIAVDLLTHREAWLAWCAKKGVRPSAAMRDLVRDQLGRGRAKSRQPDVTVRVHSPERASERREIAMTPSELSRVIAMAEIDGFSVSKWLVAVVRARLTGTPQFGAAELQALTESNRQLAAIGRQLHQLNRVLSGHASEAPEISSIDTIRRQIAAHTTHVSRLVASNLERWSLK